MPPHPPARPDRPGFYEFFAGGGLARAGLGPGWTCLHANDLDPAKARSYRANWGGAELEEGDVHDLSTERLPGRADLAWASFPCQDLSLAGAGAGLAGARSGTFRPFWSLVEELSAQGRAPRLVAVENVCGTLTSHGGRDMAAICGAFAGAGYRWGALVIDASLFVPQSRPRLFVVGAHDELPFDPALTAGAPGGPFHTRALRSALADLPEAVAARRVWWSVPPPPPRRLRFADLLECDPADAPWRSDAWTARLLELMAPLHRARVEAARRGGGREVGGVYRRTRLDADGAKVQRAEVRFDATAGCLRTPAGGSSRQMVLVVEDGRVRARLVSPRETARLMGLPDRYRLPAGANAAYHLTGDGVAVPVVRHLAHALFEPLLGLRSAARSAA